MRLRRLPESQNSKVTKQSQNSNRARNLSLCGSSFHKDALPTCRDCLSGKTGSSGLWGPTHSHMPLTEQPDTTVAHPGDAHLPVLSLVLTTEPRDQFIQGILPAADQWNRRFLHWSASEMYFQTADMPRGIPQRQSQPQGWTPLTSPAWPRCGPQHQPQELSSNSEPSDTRWSPVGYILLQYQILGFQKQDSLNIFVFVSVIWANNSA